MAVAVPIEHVAAAADVMFLLLFLQVNVAILTIRKKYGDKLDYGFLIPFFPYLPILGVVTKLGLALFMFHYSHLAWYAALGWIGVGGLIYYFYARGRERAKVATAVVLRERAPRAAYRVLVPVANPRRAGALIDFAATMARAHDGEVVLLHVITVPSQTPLEVGRRFIREAYEEVLDQATETLERQGVRSSSIIRIGHKPAEAIIHEIEDSDIDLVVLGWRGSRRGENTLGSNIDWILRAAPSEVAVLRADDLSGLHRILVPVAYPRQARRMIEVASILAGTEGGVELMHVVPPDLPDQDRRDRVDELYHNLSDLGVGGLGTHPNLPLREVSSRDVAETVGEESADYDLTVIGAAREGLIQRLVLGTKPEQIARRSRGRLLLFKQRRHPLRSRVLDIVDFFRGDAPTVAPATEARA